MTTTKRIAGTFALVTLATAIAACSHHGGPEAPTAIPVAQASATPAANAPAPENRPRTDPEPALDSKESRAVARTLERMSAVRGIRSLRPVPGVKLDRDALVAKIKEKALREFPPDALRREGQLLQLLGFAPASFNYLDETLKLLEEQLEGFYEPNNGTMYLAADLKGPEAEATLAHELVHALQDQTWDLRSRSSYRPGKGDETLALGCLAEGDATSSMMDFMLQESGKTALDMPEAAMRELMAVGMNGPSTKSIPHILRTTLVAPYIDGLSFIHELRRRGGWPMVDQVWTHPPVTTEQVLHVDKWVQHEPAITIKTPPAATLGPAFRLVDDDSFGELGFAIAYEEWLDRADARAAAAGWGGDRSGVYTTADEIAFAVHVRYDDATTSVPAGPRHDLFAARALTKLSPGLKKHVGKPAIDTADVVCIERKQLGPLIVARRDRDVVIASGPARMAKGTWSSTSTCAKAKTWANEILAAP
jgi:hypothetical protein